MKYIFITGMGRSGTVFTSKLLSLIKGVKSQHEFIGNREFNLSSYYLPQETYAIPFLERSKKNLEEQFDSEFYAEVNGHLQNSVPALLEVFKPERIYHLVRDPRKVIPSIYARRISSKLQPMPKNRIEMDRWLDDDKFYQVCWNWANTTSQLLDQETELLRFEDLRNDFNYINEKLLIPFSWELDKNDWEKLSDIRVNRTRSRTYRWIYSKIKRKSFVSDRLPNYEQWSKNQKEIFRELCEEVMFECGYEDLRKG